MQLYLKIANPGEAPPELFTLLGASTTNDADVEGTIGQFGTGVKHFVRLCLVNDINPIIYCGNLSLAYYTEPTHVDDGLVTKTFDRICYQVSGKDRNGQSVRRTEKTSMTTEFGQYDWTELNMGLREVVSNALDRAIRERMARTGIATERAIGNSYIQDVQIEIVDESKVRAKSGETRIFIPYTGEVAQFHSQLGRRFLQFGEPHLLKQQVLQKNDRNITGGVGPVIYRGGVYVRTIRTELPSLFDYNLPPTCSIDECRNMDDYAINYSISKIIADSPASVIIQIFKNVAEHKRFYEISDLLYIRPDHTELRPNVSNVVDKRKVEWGKAWNAVFNDAIICPNSQLILERVIRKGFIPQIIDNSTWRSALEEYGVKTHTSVLTNDEKEGRDIHESPTHVKNTLSSMWDLLQKHNLTHGKEMPGVLGFTELMNAGVQRLGFYRDGICYIHKDIEAGGSSILYQTLLEEIAHHITGSTDNSQDFQEYAFRVATTFMMK